MNITLECLPCFVKHTLQVLKDFSPNEDSNERVLRKVLSRMAELDFKLTPPEFAGEIHSLIREELNCKDPYSEIKRNSNLLAEKLVDKLEEKIASSENPLHKSVLYSIAGNIIDSGVCTVTSIDEIMTSIEMAEQEVPAIDDYIKLEQAIVEAKTILVLGDNAGEIVFDRLLLKNIPAGKKLFYAVKSGPILNDAIVEDAHSAGIENYAQVIENGTQIPGTPLARVSADFLKIYHNADLIISKGQANFETLTGIIDERVFFLLRAKCNVIARKAGVKQGSFMVFCNSRKLF